MHQEPSLIPHLSVAQNLFLTREPLLLGGIINWRLLYKMSKDVLSRVGAVAIDPRKPVNTLDVVQQQVVAIARMIDQGSEILVFDEPTARLGIEETKRLFQLLHKIKENGISVIYISHHLEEIFEIADRVTILRDGKKIGTWKIDELTQKSLVAHMVGEEITNQGRVKTITNNIELEEIFKGQQLEGERFKHFDINVRAGEIIGILGGVGSGKNNLARVIYGAEKLISGEMFLNGKIYNPHSPSQAIKKGVAFCPRDRRTEGLFLKESIRDNITLIVLKELSYGKIFPSRRREKKLTDWFVQELEIENASIYQRVKFLSGGNQQKVVLARWLASRATLFILEEVTTGVDVRAKEEIYKLTTQLANQGKGVIWITNDIPEAMRLCDRLLIMYRGRCVAECDPIQSSEGEIHTLVMGGKK